MTAGRFPIITSRKGTFLQEPSAWKNSTIMRREYLFKVPAWMSRKIAADGRKHLALFVLYYQHHVHTLRDSFMFPVFVFRFSELHFLHWLDSLSSFITPPVCFSSFSATKHQGIFRNEIFCRDFKNGKIFIANWFFKSFLTWKFSCFYIIQNVTQPGDKRQFEKKKTYFLHL